MPVFAYLVQTGRTYARRMRNICLTQTGFGLGVGIADSDGSNFGVAAGFRTPPGLPQKAKPGNLTANDTYVLGSGTKPYDSRVLVCVRDYWCTHPLMRVRVHFVFSRCVRAHLRAACAVCAACAACAAFAVFAVFAACAACARCVCCAARAACMCTCAVVSALRLLCCWCCAA